MRRFALAALLAVTAMACAGSDDDPGNSTPMPDGSVSTDGPPSITDGPPSMADGGPSTTTDTAVSTAGFPCPVEAVLRARCQGCHGNPLAFGAPMPLLTWQQTQTTAPGSTQKVWERMKAMVFTGQMPPGSTPTGPLSASEKQTLLDWLDMSAPAGTTTCSASTPGPMTTPTALPCTPAHEFRAYGATPTEPYTVPQVNDIYSCFVFQVPFASGEQATAWAPLIDDSRVVHHWILYTQTQATKPVGCNGTDRVFVAGWAPGSGTYVMPSNVGLDLPEPGTWLSLEIHYNNKARHQDARDRTGVAFCTTKTPRPVEAGVITIGTNRISIPVGATAHPVTGECGALDTSVGLSEPITVLGTSPHMHQLGVAFRTEVIRNGTTTALVDIPKWDFNDQRYYPLEPTGTIRPGDVVRTVCTYKNPGSGTVRFGPGTSDEMCLNFVLAYPINKVASRTCVR